MRWLFTFAVVGRALADPFRQACEGVIEGTTTVAAVEQFLRESLQGSGPVLFYRALLDPSEALHRQLAFWVISQNPGIFTLWRLYVTYGVLCATTSTTPSLGSKRVSVRDVLKAAAGVDAEAALAFLEGYLAAAFLARSSSMQLIATARMLGPAL